MEMEKGVTLPRHHKQALKFRAILYSFGYRARMRTHYNGSIYIFKGKNTIRFANHPPGDSSDCDISIHPFSEDTIQDALLLCTPTDKGMIQHKIRENAREWKAYLRKTERRALKELKEHRRGVARLKAEREQEQKGAPDGQTT